MRRIIFAIALALATPAFAQEDEPRAAPGSIAIGIIENAGAEGVFDIVHNGQVSVRHLGSGMICDFDAEGGGRVVIFPGLPRGDNVACDAMNERAAMTLYATRYPFTTNVQEQLAGAEAAIRQRFSDATPYPNYADIEADGLPEHRTAEYFITRDGVRNYTAASVALVGEWTIKLRYTAVAATDDEARQAELTAGLLFASTLSRMIEARETAE